MTEHVFSVLNVSSVEDDRTTRARIRDAAVSRFARDGVSDTTLRDVAADADVSVGLIAHHFGSKDGLRRAVDDHLLTLFRQWATELREEDISIVGGFVDKAADHVDGLRYIARALVEGTPEAATLYDELVDMSESLLAEAEAVGWIRPAGDRRMRAALLLTWDMGTFVLADHVSRATGSSIFEREGMQRWSQEILEIYARGLLTDESWLHAADAAVLRRQEAAPGSTAETSHTDTDNGKGGS